jgi:hypothetical protein
LVYQIDECRKRLLWVDQERKVKTLLRSFHYVLDRFHIMGHMST